MSTSTILAGTLAGALTAATPALSATTARLRRTRRDLAAATHQAATEALTGLANRRTLA
jgi:PleD family two-component response regulator